MVVLEKIGAKKSLIIGYFSMAIILCLVGFLSSFTSEAFKISNVILVLIAVIIFSLFIGGTPFVLSAKLTNERGIGIGISCNQIVYFLATFLGRGQARL